MRLFETEDRPLYYKHSPAAWRTKTLTLSCELEGFLSRVINFMWDTGQCVPDTNEGAMMLRLNVLKFRKLAAELIASGHLVRGQGYLFNARAMREIEEWNKMRLLRVQQALEREMEKKKKRKAEAVAQATQPAPNPTPTPPQPQVNPDPTGVVGGGLGRGCVEVEAKKSNENNGTPPDDCSIRERKEKEKEKEKNLHSLTPPFPPPGAGMEGADDVGDGEGTLHPALAFAIGELAKMFGSDTDPDHDKAYRVAHYWAQAYSPDDVRSAVMDFAAAGRDGRRNGRLTEGMFGRWVKQAYQDRTRLDAKPSPALKRIPPGPIAEGFAMGEDGRVSLANGKRAEWLERFGQDEALLDLTLIQLSAKVRANSPTPVVAQIEAALATASRDIVVRRKNAIAAVEARDSKNAPTPVTETFEQKMDRIAQEMASGN